MSALLSSSSYAVARDTPILFGDSIVSIGLLAPLELSHATNLAVAGWSLGPLTLEGNLRLVGSYAGLPHGFVVDGRWVHSVERWTVGASLGPLRITAGDTSIPVLSSLYLKGRSLRGVTAVAGGTLGCMNITVTGFQGVNISNSGLSVNSTYVTGGVVEACLNRNMGLSLQTLNCERTDPNLRIGGIQAWWMWRDAQAVLQTAISERGGNSKFGWCSVAELKVPLFLGNASMAVRYVSPEFGSLNDSIRAGENGAYKVAASWKGPLVSPGLGGIRIQPGVNIDLCCDSTIDASLEGVLTVAGDGWMAGAGYRTVSQRKGPGYQGDCDRATRSARMDFVVPIEVGQVDLNVSGRLTRCTRHDRSTGTVEMLDSVNLQVVTSAMDTHLTLGTGWSNFENSSYGTGKREFNVALGLSKPTRVERLTAGLDLKACDIRVFGDGCRDMEGSKSHLDACAWARYGLAPWIEIAVKAKAKLSLTGPACSTRNRDGHVEVEVKLLF